MNNQDNFYPRVAALGGGTGLSALLRGLKHFPLDITAIVTVADDGGSSGVLLRQFDMPPPGDIRNVLVALSEDETLLGSLFQYRFATEDAPYLDGHALGNLLICAMHALTGGDFVQAVENVGRVLNIKGRVYPVAACAAVLKAELADGRLVAGESLLATHGSPIRRVFYDAVVPAVPAAVHAVAEADVIVLGPGSLYTSVLPNVLLPQVRAAINANERADVVYVCNIMTEAGETDGYDVADHLDALLRHGIRRVDHVIVNDEPIPDVILARYRDEGAASVRIDADRLAASGVNVIRSRNASFQDGIVRHDPIKTAASVFAVALDRL
ncbi:uridine diphosphate-N-acetylglucosamine-binding protein YvcK [Chitiniphilus purpureus]|uniref:Putative gluconeogenesis factor n=1 Tax=Chitiniphilus purpureus TaxID=2981137 RepID=A0ABY6DRC8_9NEIS|nr:uridine diphosphate-N-acetylglucosamine-binding protein YvcK [Chitiniphilus sp. CD1]UXY16268.1 uridine diphosphate-N-acetylglucosamine-binding protein YvcK [Chitiniphilus sp. CD1]